MERFEKIAGSLDPVVIRAHAERFSVARFREEVEQFVMGEFRGDWMG